MMEDPRTHTYRTADGQSDAGSFRDLLLPEPLVAALEIAGFTRPSPLQKAAIPVVREGTDVIVQATSGAGKTAVFAAVLLERVSLATAMPQALVLAPTRELAFQTHQVLARISAGLPESHQPVAAVFVGGLPTADDEKRLRRTCHIVIGTPGRVCALVDSGALVLNKITSVVLDEVDQLMGGSFLGDIKWLVKQLPSRKQVLAFSATYTPQLTRTVESLMRSPQKVLLCEETVSLLDIKQYYKLIGPSSSSSSSSSNQDISQATDPGDNHANLSPQETGNGVQLNPMAAAESASTSRPQHQQQQQQQDPEMGQQQQQREQQQQGTEAKQQQQEEQLQQQQGSEAQQQQQQQQQHCTEQELLSVKVESLLELLSAVSFHQAVVFCNTRSVGEWLSRRMTAGGYPAAYISADLPQTQRKSAMEAINGFKVRVIVSTYVMACGVDLHRVNLVVNLDLPANAAAYVHRVGRTGSRGCAVAFVTQSELNRLQQYLQNVPGGAISPLPDVIPDDFHTYKLESEWEQQALQELLTAPTTTPPNSPPPMHKQPQRPQRHHHHQQQQQQQQQQEEPEPASLMQTTPEPFWGTSANSIAFWQQQQQQQQQQPPPPHQQPQQQHINPDSFSSTLQTPPEPIWASTAASNTSWQQQQQQQHDPGSLISPVSPKPFWANNTTSIAFWQQQQQQEHRSVDAESAMHGSSDLCTTAAAAADPDLAASWDAWAEYYISCGYSYPYENPYRQRGAVGGGQVPQQQQQQQQLPPQADLQTGGAAPTTDCNGALTHGLLDNSVTPNGNSSSGMYCDTDANCQDESVLYEGSEDCELPTDDDELDPGAALLLSRLSVVTRHADPATGNHVEVEQTRVHIQNGGTTAASLEDDEGSGQVAGVCSAVEASGQLAQRYMQQDSCGYVPVSGAEATATSAAVDAGLRPAARCEDVGAVCHDCWAASYAAWRREYEVWRQQYESWCRHVV